MLRVPGFTSEMDESVKILANSYIAKVDRIGMERGKTNSGVRVTGFTSERDEELKILVNCCIVKVDRIVMEG